MAKQVQLDEKGYRKFGMRDSLAYAAGDFGCNMSFALKGTMAIFWTQFMRMDLWYAALLLVCCLISLRSRIRSVLKSSIVENIREM